MPEVGELIGGSQRIHLAEDLEQLKVLENGYRMKVALVLGKQPLGVDTPEDIERVEKYLCP